MVILLVYGDAPEPLTLILHGNNGQTWFSIVEDAGQRADASLYAATRQALHSPISLSHLE